MTRLERVRIVSNDQADVEKFVLSVSRAAKQGVAG
jgi:threonine synthase